MIRMAVLFIALSLLVAAAVTSTRAADDAALKLTLRSRTGAAIEENKTEWNPKKTAIIVCDMWDRHWCAGATARLDELAGPMNEMLKAARARGVLIIHAPSGVTDYYKDTPQRRLAQGAPYSKAPIDVNVNWRGRDAVREAELPIDDTDGGCDCQPHCTQSAVLPRRQNDAIEIAPGDAITDSGQETWNLLQAKGIDNVMLCGVYLNMCVLGRPFSIRQMVRVGKNVTLIRDMTDTMYNHEKRPYVSHFKGTDLMVEHIEKYWCPSLLSTDITGGAAAFRFKDDVRK